MKKFLLFLVLILMGITAYTFDLTWNEEQPGDSDYRREGAQRIRETRQAVRERMAIDHYWNATNGSHAQTGWHKAIHMSDLNGTADEGVNNTIGRVGNSIYYYDNTGNSSRLSGHASGEIFFMLSGNCPSDSTDVTATYANMTIRFDATGNSTGGSATHTHSGTGLTATDAGHTHSTGYHSNGYQYAEGVVNYDPTENTGSGTASITVAGTTAAGSSWPPYVTCKVCLQD